MSPTASIADAIASPSWQVLTLIGVVATLTSVIAYLFKRYEKRERTIAAERKVADEDRAKLLAQIAAERSQWAIERAQWDTESADERAKFDDARAALAEKYAQELRAEQLAARAHEDAVRKEFAEIMETVSAEAERASQALVGMLQKFYDRFVGPRARY